MLKTEIPSDVASSTANARLLHDLIEAVPAGVYVRTLDGRFLLVNKMWEAVTGKTRQDVLGKNVSDIFSPENAAAWVHANQEVVRLRRPITTEESIDVN